MKIIKQIILASTISLLLILSLILNINTNAQNVAGSNIQLTPGQSARVNITYNNESPPADSTTVTDALINIRVGNYFTVDPNSFTDQFGNDPAYPIDASSLSVTPTWTGGYEINYRPRSANTAGTPSGSGTPADVEMPFNTDGVISFEVTLNSNVIGQTNPIDGETIDYGYVFRPINEQGVYAELTHTGPSGNATAEITFTLVTQQNNSPDFSPSISANPSPATVSRPVTITTNDINNGTNLLDGISCTTTISGNSFTASETGTVNNGVCVVNFSSDQVPTQPGTYQITTVAGSTTIGPVDLVFDAAITELPRTGGITLISFAVIFAGILSLATYSVVTKRREIKID